MTHREVVCRGTGVEGVVRKKSQGEKDGWDEEEG